MKRFCILLVLASLFAIVSTAAPAKKTDKSKSSSSIRPVSVYTLAGCPSCSSLKSRLRRSGVKLSVSPVYERYFDEFPTVIYSNHSTDNGERIYGGSAACPAASRSWRSSSRIERFSKVLSGGGYGTTREKTHHHVLKSASARDNLKTAVAKWHGRPARAAWAGRPCHLAHPFGDCSRKP